MTASTPNRDSFALRLQQMMNTKGFNQTSLATKSGIDRTVINRMLKGTRHPKPFEIGVLAQCFDVSPDDLMAGLELPPQVQRIVDQERERTERVLAAEAARDEANARAEQLAKEVARLQSALESERNEARKTLEGRDVAWQKRLKNVEVEHTAKQKTSATTVRNLKTMLEHSALKLREHEAALVALRRQISTLQQQLAQERSAKAGASVLGGLLGMAIGRAMD